MNATKLAKALLVLSLGLGSVALALHQDNADRDDGAVYSRLAGSVFHFVSGDSATRRLVSHRVVVHRLISHHLPAVKYHGQADVPHRRVAAQ